MARRSRRVNRWLVIGSALVASLAATAVFAQFTAFSDHSGAILEGNWQSCLEEDGQYGERIYDGRLPGFGPFELHMGPYHDFALFRGVQAEHRDHASADNLLRPSTVPMSGTVAKHRWDVAGL